MAGEFAGRALGVGHALVDLRPRGRPVRLHVAHNFGLIDSQDDEHDGGDGRGLSDTDIGGAATADRLRGKPLLVLCHGFPDCWITWNRLMKHLAAHGVGCVAPDHRGFGFTETFIDDDGAAGDVHDDDPNDSQLREARHYAHAEVCLDLCALVDHLGADRCVFGGHDWGGQIVWSMAVAHPERVLGVLAVCTPFKPPSDKLRALAPAVRDGSVSLMDLMRRKAGRLDYQVYFTDSLADAQREMERDVALTLRFMLRGTGKADVANLKAACPPKATFGVGVDTVRARGGLLVGVDADKLGDTEMLTAEENDAYVQAFKHSGFRGGLQWYRNLDRNTLFWVDLPPRNLQLAADLPCMMVCGARDPVLKPRLSDSMFRDCANLRRATLAGGHWLHLEDERTFSSMVLSWLEDELLLPKSAPSARL